MTGVDLTADQATGSRAQDNGKDQSWPRAAADSSRPRKESLLQSNRLRSFDHIGSSRSAKSPVRGMWPSQNQGHFQVSWSTYTA
jgi:hypothetical protein